MRVEKIVTTTILLASLAAFSWAKAADFTWRGQLADGGEPANGSFDLSVAVYADESDEAALGGLIEFGAVSVADGAFAVTLALDDAIDLDRVWLEVSVRDAGDSRAFETLAQRQRIDLKPAAVCPASWETSGNAGLTFFNFLGTTDETSLRLAAGNRTALWVFPSNDLASNGDAPTLILGSSANTVVGADLEGATISGGGSTLVGGISCGGTCGNRVGGDFASIGGGSRNQATGENSRVGGGRLNEASASGATVAGGDGNAAGAFGAVVGGGFSNRASGGESTVSGGFFNMADGIHATIGGGYSSRASGQGSTVPGGEENVAGGDYSFAAGRAAHVRDPIESGDSDGDEGTFFWADFTNLTFPGLATSSGPNQFLVRAGGGFGLNATPINPDVEMNIRPNGLGSNYANVFLRQRGTNAGVLWSVGDATGSSNNAALYIDQYDGSAQTRRLTLAGNGDLIVSAGAFKPGGGSWASSSDARLKKNVAGLEHALDRLLALEGVSFEYTDPDRAARPQGRLMGFVAQQVEPLFPNWIGHDAEGYLTVGTQGFEALSVEAVRELRGEKDREIGALRSENEALTDKLKANEALTAELHAELESFRTQQARLAARLDALEERPPAPEEQRIASTNGR